MILFLLGLIFAIVIHEMAHFYAAIRSGCGVEVVSIGFGKAFFKFRFHDIDYQLCWILLGGYCQLKGELEYTKCKKAFTNLSYRNKCYVALAGIGANCITGLLSIYLGIILQQSMLIHFGFLSLALGLSNLIPFPALDGSYPILFLAEKKFGKKEGLKLVRRSVEVGMTLINILNITCVIVIAYIYLPVLLTSLTKYVILLVERMKSIC